MIIFFSIFFAVYSALNYYIFIRGWQALNNLHFLKTYYLIIFIVFSFSYIIAKFLQSYIPGFLYEILIWIGSFWFAFLLYFILAIVLIDLLRLSDSIFHIFPAFVRNNYETAKQITALSVLVITLIISAAGYINTRNPIVKTLNIQLPKKLSNLDHLNAALISDIHISPVNDGSLITKIVEKVNSLNPDIIFIAGDIVDDKADVLFKHKLNEPFKKLKSKYGVYACTGNHEFINGIKPSVKFIEDSGINLLRDSSKFIDNNFYITARDDRSKNQFTRTPRKKLEEILESVDKEYPVILMDHTPFGLEDAENNKIDLQLSGHTHYGQMWPLGYITNMVYEKSWGYLEKSITQYYVSCGVGTWGPPVRTGSPSEIVNLKIKFIPNLD